MKKLFLIGLLSLAGSVELAYAAGARFAFKDPQTRSSRSVVDQQRIMDRELKELAAKGCSDVTIKFLRRPGLQKDYPGFVDLLKQRPGIRLEGFDDCGNTILHHIASSGCAVRIAGIISMLKATSFGSTGWLEVNAVNDANETALDCALNNEYADIMNQLEQLGGKFKEQLEKEAAAQLIQLASAGDTDGVIRLLKKEVGSNLNYPDEDNKTPLYYIALYGNGINIGKVLSALRTTSFGSASWLDINCDSFHSPVLDCARKAGRSDMVKQLEQLGGKSQAELDREAAKKFAELVSAGDIDAVREFLKEHPGVNLGYADENGNTILHNIAIKSYADILDLIASCVVGDRFEADRLGLKVNALNNNKKTAFDCVMEKNSEFFHEHIARQIRIWGGDYSSVKRSST